MPILLAISVWGCAHPPVQRSTVSQHLEGRTGHALGPVNAPGTFALPPGIALDRELTDQEAVEVALWNNAAFLEVLADLGLARADLIQAGQLANPSFSILFPNGSKQLEFAAKFPLETLWLRPKRLAAAKVESQRVIQRLVQCGLDLVRDVKLACAALRLANEQARLAGNTADGLDEIGALNESRFRAGDISELEVVSARIEVWRAQEDAKRSKTQAVLAQERLRALLGLSVGPGPIRLAALAPLPCSDRPVDELVGDGLANRPDLRAAELGLEAAGERVSLARSEIFNLTGILDENGTGNDFEIGPGLELPIPLLHQNQAGRTMARAKLDQAARHYIAVRDQIALEIRQAHARWLRALDVEATWTSRMLPALDDQLESTRRALAAGNVSPLSVLEVSRKASEARASQAAAQAELLQATAELERAIGHRLNVSTLKTTLDNQP